MPPESDDREELLERRLTDKVTDSVERSLKARFSWVLIISSVLFGGTIYGIIANITREIVDPSKDTLNRANLQLENAEKSLAKLDDLAEKSREKLDQINKTINSAVAKFEERTSSLEQRQEQIQNGLDQKSEDLRSLVGSVTDFNNLVSQVKGLSQTVSQLVEKTPPTAATPTAQKSLKEQQQVLGDISQRGESTVQKLAAYNTTVFFQFSGSVSRDIARQIADELKIRGYLVPGVEFKQSNAREVRYYYPEDRAVAAKLVADTTAVLRGKGFSSLTVKQMDYTGWERAKPPRGTVELWLDLPLPAQ